MTLPCFVLRKDSSYTFIAEHKFKSGAMAATVAETIKSLVSERHRGKWNEEIELYKVSLHLPLRSLF